MRSSHSLDRIDTAFDGTQLVADAGLMLPATLAQRLGVKELVEGHLDLGKTAGRANPGDKVLTLVMSALAGGDCIDDAAVLLAGGTDRVFGFTVKAASTLGTFLRSFRWGHVRQLDAVSRHLLARAWGAGAGPGAAPFTIDLDSTICETYGLKKEGALHHGYTKVRGYHPLLAVAAGTGDVLMARLREGRANTVRGAAHFLRETIGRVRGAGATGELTLRADSGFYAHAVVETCRKMDVRFSITIRMSPALHALIDAIPDDAWTPIPYWLAGGADVAETTYTPRSLARRMRSRSGSSCAGYDRRPGPSSPSSRSTITTPSSPTGSARPSPSRPTTAGMPRSRTRSGTSSTGWASTTCRRASSPPTPPGSRFR
jgi:Transposase DDE domain group 1